MFPLLFLLIFSRWVPQTPFSRVGSLVSSASLRFASHPLSHTPTLSSRSGASFATRGGGIAAPKSHATQLTLRFNLKWFSSAATVSYFFGCALGGKIPFNLKYIAAAP
jgi:hypothetical protein